MTENVANREASAIIKRWTHIVSHWEKLFQPTLMALGNPFATIPHWQEIAENNAPTDEQIAAFQNEPKSSDEIAEMFAPVVVNGELASVGVTLNGVWNLFSDALQAKTANDQRNNTTQWTDAKNLRGAMKFFDGSLPMADLTTETLKDAKRKMLAKKLAVKTARNYCGIVKRMLVWFYDSVYGKLFRDERITNANIDDAFYIHGKDAPIKTYDFKELKTLMGSLDETQQLYAMLALNCGMIQADIGRLTLDEIDLAQGYAFWDREKQPDNAFKVRHDLWPETLTLVKRFIQPPKTAQRFYTDYRRHQPNEVDCSTLAFVNPKGEPLYRVRPKGKATDLVGKRFSDHDGKDADGNKFAFSNLRKSTNTILKDLLRDKVEGDSHGQIIAITEISDTFLSHASPELQLRYDAKGVKAYGLMNKWLAEVAQLMRANKVFETLPDAP